MKLIIIFSLLLTLSFADHETVKSPDVVTEKSLVGLYYRGPMPEIVMLRFKPNGEYEAHSVDSQKTMTDTSYKVGINTGSTIDEEGFAQRNATGSSFGTWQFIDGKLVLMPKTETGELKGYFHQINLVKGNVVLRRSEDDRNHCFYRQEVTPVDR